MAATEARTKRAHPFTLWTPDSQALNLLGDKWTLPIIRELVPGALRRHELQRRLGISTEMLGSRIAAMEDDGLLVKRDLSTGRLHVEYELTDRGRGAVPVVAELARFGLRHTWARPTPAQRVDLRAMFELLPILMHDLELPAGEDRIAVLAAGNPDTLAQVYGGMVEIIAAPRSDTHQVVAVRFQGGEAPYVEHNRDAVLQEAFVVIAAREREWVRVLTQPTMKGLTIRGDVGMAGALVAALRGGRP